MRYFTIVSLFLFLLVGCVKEQGIDRLSTRQENVNLGQQDNHPDYQNVFIPH
ncbi:hypothetical protein [Oceanobacillus kapialis]|uniref:hypothetical protein n=1 Tax=Oceanobacillus kapialis TaxID=481353 RepID=UPI0038503468